MSDDSLFPQLSLAERLRRQIEVGGPISVAHYMAEANAQYYGTRDPLGTGGDFITAPEISQMFGEFMGLCLADVWQQSGRRAGALYVELGPGRGTLAQDALRAMASAGLSPQPHFVETSPALRDRQRAAIPSVTFHDDLDTLPDQGPLLVIANEFFDALPVRQMVRTEAGWRERVVIAGDEGRFSPMPGYRAMDAAVPSALADSAVGTIVELSPAAATVALALASRIAKQGGAALLIDYGYEGPAAGETLQAVRGHAHADPFADVGESDLTAHVDFTLIGHMARQAGLQVLGPVGQGDFLKALGIDARAAQLARQSPDRAEEITAARMRLVMPEEMGSLFKVMALVHPDWALPEGFA